MAYTNFASIGDYLLLVKVLKDELYTDYYYKKVLLEVKSTISYLLFYY